MLCTGGTKALSEKRSELSRPWKRQKGRSKQSDPSRYAWLPDLGSNQGPTTNSTEVTFPSPRRHHLTALCRGLRKEFANRMYFEETGVRSPVQGGPRSRRDSLRNAIASGGARGRLRGHDGALPSPSCPIAVPPE